MDMQLQVNQQQPKLIFALVFIFLLQYPLYSQDTLYVDVHSVADSTVGETSQKAASSDFSQQTIEMLFQELPQELIANEFQDFHTTIPMIYNKTVKGFIHGFTVRNRPFVTAMLRRKNAYFPIYEEQLKKYGLPDELKYLSIIESSLNPRAISRAKAVGLWQFMPATGKQYNLYQDAYIDERMDPYKATEAACQYLKDLYGMFGNWHLALAAYNCGPGNVRKAIRLSGNKKEFWQIYTFLPKETRAYVPKFIAVTYIMRYAQEYNITADSVARYIPSDTILLSQPLNLERLAEQLDIPFDDLCALNPHVKKNIVPAYLKNYCLRIPFEKKEFFVSNRDSILLVLSTLRNNSHAVQFAKNTSGDIIYRRKMVSHTVRQGEAISMIANRYKVSVASIRQWNRLKNDHILIGQKLDIWIQERVVAPVNEPVDRWQAIEKIEPIKNTRIPFIASTGTYITRPLISTWTISRLNLVEVAKPNS